MNSGAEFQARATFDLPKMDLKALKNFFINPAALNHPVALYQTDPTQTISIQNRRFLGNKYKLISFIKEVVDKEAKQCRTFCDLFAGTGVVGAAFNQPGVKVISNDLLYSNYVTLKAFLGSTEIDQDIIAAKIYYLNQLKGKENYFSEHFGGTYFSIENAKRIGTIRQEIEEIASSSEEKLVLITSLLYAVDKIANTVGHYDAFRKQLDNKAVLLLKTPLLYEASNGLNEVYQKDANELIREIECDVLYLDPPYNSRQYADAYHLLENLAKWGKPAVFGKAKKMDRMHLKSRYSLKSAPEAFEELIKDAKAKHILVSYNNTGSTKDGRSNAKISDEQILAILRAKGMVKIFEHSHKAFSTGKSVTEGNSERVFYCKVK